jgi:uncharacterized protein
MKVGPSEALVLTEALMKEMHDASLLGFYHVARSLLVHRETDLDTFDQVFAHHFRGVALASTQIARELLDWLRDPKAARELTDEERASLEALDWETIKERFEERLRNQDKRHDGGNRNIGTGGQSPFGYGGQNPAGIRVGPQGGARSALAVADARRFRPYRSDVVLDVRQIEVALRRLRVLAREGLEEELDLDASIEKTGRNAGEIEVVLRARKKSNVRVILLMDVGGSMDPFSQSVSQLFSAAKRASSIRSLRSYYFHNCLYGHVYETESFRDPLSMLQLFRETNENWKLVIVGDAAMHPGELYGRGDFGAYSNTGRNDSRRTGLDWLHELRATYKRTVWLNPDPPSYWRGGTAEVISNIFPMVPLTLDGLSEAVSWLTHGRALTS